MLLFWGFVKGLFKLVHSLRVLLKTAKDATSNLCLATKLVKRWQLQYFSVFYILHTVIGKLIKKGL